MPRCIVNRVSPGCSSSGLDSAGVVSLMEAAAGHDLGDDAVPLAQAIYRETDGNPFFVTELLRHLAESEVIVQDADGRWTLAGPLELAALPDTVRMVIEARVRRLGPQAERVLSLAAVIGRDFDLDVLATAAATSDDELLDILDAATAAALVQEMVDVPGRYNFSHALIQRTLYEGLGPTRRARAHRQVAEAIEHLDAGSSQRRGSQNSLTIGSTLGPTFRRRWSTPAGPPMPRWLRSLPPRRCATTPKPKTCTARRGSTIRC